MNMEDRRVSQVAGSEYQAVKQHRVFTLTPPHPAGYPGTYGGR